MGINNNIPAPVTVKEMTALSDDMNESYFMEALLDPVFSIGQDGLIIHVNKAAQTITGLSQEELQNTYLFDHFTESQKAFESYREIFGQGLVSAIALTLKKKDGALAEVLYSGAIYRNKQNEVPGALVVVRDISDQKKFENDLIIAKKNAEKAKQVSEEAVKTKQQFLSNMSHEIRTPLNAIIGFTKVVLKTNLNDKQKEYLNAIKISGDALIVLINDILDLAKVEAGKMTFEKAPFKLVSSVTAMLHLFETKIHNSNISLVSEYDAFIPEVLVGDPIRLHQIILNLVSNAVKFTKRGKITVGIRMLTEDKEKVTLEFSVADTGIGIPEDQLQNIFDNFHQASSRTARLYGGTGLGLAIVKQLIESQGGSLWVKSKVDVGSTFTFILTFRKFKEHLSETELTEKKSDHLIADEQETIPTKNARILVVEDVTLNQLLMKTLLEEFGFEMEIAANGRAAIEKLKQKKFDLVLMDIQMPEMDGFEATQYIRNELHSKVPIIALTADVTTVDVEKCKAVGMDDYIAKPIQDKLLHNKIIKYIKDPGAEGPKAAQSEQIVNLDYLSQHTKGNAGMMERMVQAYLRETPQLVEIMKKSIDNMDWNALQGAAHSIIPTFSIMGMSKEFESMAKAIQEHAKKREGSSVINDLVLKIEEACNKACHELAVKFKMNERNGALNA